MRGEGCRAAESAVGAVWMRKCRRGRRNERRLVLKCVDGSLRLSGLRNLPPETTDEAEVGTGGRDDGKEKRKTFYKK